MRRMHMQKKQKQLSNYPVWFDGTNINEAAFCEEFLHTHKILFANNAFFTPEGRITDDLPLRGEIFESLKHYAINNVPRKVTNILEVMKLAAYVEDFPPKANKIHLANGNARNMLTSAFGLSHFWMEIQISIFMTESKHWLKITGIINECFLPR